MRLLIFISSMGSGGAERVSANLANYWAAKGWEITIVTLAQQSLDFYELHPAVKRIALELAGDSANVLAGLWQNIRRVIALRRVLRQIQPDIALGMMVDSQCTAGSGGLELAHSAHRRRRTYPPPAIAVGLYYGKLYAVIPTVF